VATFVVTLEKGYSTAVCTKEVWNSAFTIICLQKFVRLLKWALNQCAIYVGGCQSNVSLQHCQCGWMGSGHWTGLRETRNSWQQAMISNPCSCKFKFQLW
jgi:hypothetical protein